MNKENKDTRLKKLWLALARCKSSDPLDNIKNTAILQAKKLFDVGNIKEANVLLAPFKGYDGKHLTCSKIF